MPTPQEVIFMLSDKTDGEFREALKKMESDFPGWKIVSLSREEKTVGNITVPYGVIKLQP